MTDVFKQRLNVLNPGVRKLLRACADVSSMSMSMLLIRDTPRFMLSVSLLCLQQDQDTPSAPEHRYPGLPLVALRAASVRPLLVLLRDSSIVLASCCGEGVNKPPLLICLDIPSIN